MDIYPANDLPEINSIEALAFIFYTGASPIAVVATYDELARAEEWVELQTIGQFGDGTPTQGDLEMARFQLWSQLQAPTNMQAALEYGWWLLGYDPVFEDLFNNLSHAGGGVAHFSAGEAPGVIRIRIEATAPPEEPTPVHPSARSLGLH